MTAATQSLQEILKECVAPHMASIGSVTSSASGPAQYIAKMFRAVEEGLTYKFHAAWGSVLQLLGVFFQACGKQAHPVMKKCLQSLCDLRLSPISLTRQLWTRRWGLRWPAWVLRWF